MKRSAKGVKIQVKEALKEFANYKEADTELELISTLRAKPYVKSEKMQFRYEIEEEEHSFFPSLARVLKSATNIFDQKSD